MNSIRHTEKKNKQRMKKSFSKLNKAAQFKNNKKNNHCQEAYSQT